jgi:hypothetical protein
MTSRVASGVVVLVFASIVSSVSAQIIYEPVQSQYSAGGTTYYYGGSNPLVHVYAAQPNSAGETWGRAHGWAFSASNMLSHREVSGEYERVFTDSYGNGLTDAHVAGFTADDARNEAYANQPRYFVKRDLLNAAHRDVDGTWVVPASAEPIRIYKSNGTRIDSTSAPASMPRPLMIIPKDQLEKPLRPKPSDKQVATAGN